MLLNELLKAGPGSGTPGDPNHNLQKKAGYGTVPVGRPNVKGPKKRPNKNLWFNDEHLWREDLHLENGGNYKLVQVSAENEEEGDIIACDPDSKFAFGWWQMNNRRGVTYKKPRPINTIVHPKTQLKDVWTGD